MWSQRVCGCVILVLIRAVPVQFLGPHSDLSPLLLSDYTESDEIIMYYEHEC